LAAEIKLQPNERWGWKIGTGECSLPAVTYDVVTPLALRVTVNERSQSGENRNPGKLEIIHDDWAPLLSNEAHRLCLMFSLI